jgi:hypothetical protein
VAWWRLSEALGTRRLHLVALTLLGLTSGLVSGLLMLPTGKPGLAVVMALIFGLGTPWVAMIMLMLREPRGPISLRVRGRGLPRQLIRVILVCFAVVSALSLVLALMGVMAADQPLDRLPIALGLVVVYGAAIGLGGGGLVAIVAGFRKSTTGMQATTPRSGLREDSAALLIYSLSVGPSTALVVGGLTGWWSDEASVVISSVTTLIAAIFAAFIKPASGWYALAHLTLAVRGRLSVAPDALPRRRAQPRHPAPVRPGVPVPARDAQRPPRLAG